MQTYTRKLRFRVARYKSIWLPTPQTRVCKLFKRQVVDVTVMHRMYSYIYIYIYTYIYIYMSKHTYTCASALQDSPPCQGLYAPRRWLSAIAQNRCD